MTNWDPWERNEQLLAENKVYQGLLKIEEGIDAITLNMAGDVIQLENTLYRLQRKIERRS